MQLAFPPDVCVYLEGFPETQRKCEQAGSCLEAVGVFFFDYFVFIVLVERQKNLQGLINSHSSINSSLPWRSGGPTEFGGFFALTHLINLVFKW